MNTRRKLVALLAIATLISIVNASVFVYYPITLTIVPQRPPVVFDKESNVDMDDLWDKNILVAIKDSGTNLEMEVHPTIQKNYYYNIAKIVNNDGSNAYYIKFRVIRSVSDSSVSKAYLIVNDIQIDLTDNELQPSNWIKLEASGTLRVDLYIELTGYSDGSIKVSVDLIITTTETTETPPTPPT